MLYFAYGSNMDFAQMRERSPSAKYLCNAVLPDHRLAFPRKSRKRRCGAASVIAAPGRETWGAVFEIVETEIALLDQSEGYRPGRPVEENSYVREQRHVFREGDEGQPLLVSIYFGRPEPNPPLPNAVYKSLIIAGARYWHLPEEYIVELEGIRTAE